MCSWWWRPRLVGRAELVWPHSFTATISAKILLVAGAAELEPMLRDLCLRQAFPAATKTTLLVSIASASITRPLASGGRHTQTQYLTSSSLLIHNNNNNKHKTRVTLSRESCLVDASAHDEHARGSILSDCPSDQPAPPANYNYNSLNYEQHLMTRAS